MTRASRRLGASRNAPRLLVWIIAMGGCLLAAWPLAGLAERLWQVQVGDFDRIEQARELARTIQDAGVEAIAVRHEAGYVVSAGVFRLRDNARRRREQLAERSFVDAVRVVPFGGARGGGERAPQRSSSQSPAGLDAAAPPPAAPAADDTVLLLGEGSRETQASDAGSRRDEARGFRASVEDLRVELGGLTEEDTAVDGSHYAHAAGALRWRPNDRWTVRAGARLDGYAQTGDPDADELELDYGETFVRYRGPHSRFTVGAQKVLWGRVDEIAPTERVATPDLRRYILHDLADRRLPSPAVRAEWFGRRYALDVLVVPDLRAAELPPFASIWHPVDRGRGRLIGLEPDPVPAALIRRGSFGEDTDGAGGGGVRLSRTGRAADAAITLQRIQQPMPYYELDGGVRASLLAGNSVTTALANANGPTFVERHPWTTLVGADLGLPVGGSTWRFEVAWRSDVPVTSRADLGVQTVGAVDWVVGVEIYPGDGDTRLNLQLSGQRLLDPPDRIFDREGIRALNGELETHFAHARWRADLRFLAGLDEKDLYLNPELAYVALDPHELYLGGHYFEGEPGTPGSFHEGHSLVVLGWRARY